MTAYPPYPDRTGDSETAEFVPGPIFINGKPIRGLLVVATGAENCGDRTVAIWQFDLSGNPRGAWVMTEAELLGDRTKARQMLAVCERRALAAHDPTEALEVLHSMTKAAEVVADIEAVWGQHLCLLNRAVEETGDARVAYSMAVQEEKARTGRSLAPPAWRDRLPQTASTDVADLLNQAGVVAPVGASDAASAALAVGRAVRWCLQIWTSTEAVRGRRPYLREQFGPIQPAPPSWRNAVIGAYQQILPL